MSRQGKKKVTATLLITAAVALAAALALTVDQDRAAASRSGQKSSGKVASPAKPGPAGPATPAAPATPPGKQTQEVIEKVTEKVEKEEPPKVDVVFALDTTGSMGGLIDGAKKKIWSIANQIVSGQPRPDVRIGLIGYRDRGDAYVTRRYALSEDIDEVYAHLKRFQADGGGDTPEHVNRALAEAVRQMQWREGKDVLRLIFLVGDAPPHEGRDGLYSKKIAREAADKGIIINAVRCGTMGTTATAWTRIAEASGGMYASIRQDGAMMAVSTPMDGELAELNKALSATLLPSGGEAEKRAARDRAMANAAMAAPVQAESAKYRARSGKLDSADLLTRMGRGATLEAMSEEELPAPVASLPKPARKAYVENIAQQRAELQGKIETLAKKREAYVKAARSKSKDVSFDDMVGKALKEQGARIDVAY